MTKKLKQEVISDIARSNGIPATLGGDIWYRGTHGIIVDAHHSDLIVVFSGDIHTSRVHATLPGLSFTDPDAAS